MNILAPDFSRKNPLVDFSILNPRRGHGMERLFITGMAGKPLHGRVAAMGSKNACLPEMVAAVLTADDVTLTNVPALADLETMAQMLSLMGVAIDTTDFSQKNLTLNAANIIKPFAPYDVVRKMRASIFVLGPLLARMGRASVSLPGGCAIGARPVDLHITGLEKMGAKIEVVDGYVVATAKDGLQGATIDFPFVSVGATENIMMAATLANGKTILRNAAREPEIIDLGNLLLAMGANITGLGTDCITIDGVKKLHGATHAVVSDRIEIGSILCAAASTGGQVTIDRAVPEHLSALCDVLTAIGAGISTTGDSITITMNGRAKSMEFLQTAPYPHFPTDLQAQVMAVLATADGTSQMEEAIFENRYMHVPELNRLGAKISLKEKIATIDGVDNLRAAPVMATDLRASMSLVIAGMKAVGDTIISRIYHLDRGYDGLEKKLSHLGATIARKP
ncbi:MAG: UDP-N-acetylglucosamine 1-carboxyvinyltransferase [Hydrotalea sp.]|nr:UDP-N-acetylglucosamine 1-carboxyvinyltransferase [Hydrotalea sp.]